MALHESESIVLQSYPLGEADRLVSFLSRSMGRVRGVAAGARRPKSRFGSTLERLSYVRMWFYERETRELVRINQCELIESFVDVFRDYAASIALTLLAEISEAVLPEREAADPSFRLLLLSARMIRRSSVDLPVAYFALWTARLSGWLGSLDQCARCGRELAENQAYAGTFSLGIYCRNCRKPGMSDVSASALNGGRRMMEARLDEIKSGDFTKPALLELLQYALDLIEHQLERKLVSRDLLESAI